MNNKKVKVYIKVNVGMIYIFYLEQSVDFFVLKNGIWDERFMFDIKKYRPSLFFEFVIQSQVGRGADEENKVKVYRGIKRKADEEISISILKFI